MARTFASDLSKFAKKFGLTLDETHELVCNDYFGGTIKDTPVETGALRDAWEIDGVAVGDGLTARLSSQVGRAGTVTEMVNNSPYAAVVEYGLYPTGSAGQPGSKVTSKGFSKKAPQGMMRRNFARVQQIVRRAVSTAKRRVK